MPKRDKASEKKSPKRPDSPPRFTKGDRVHVKPGVADPDFSDLPIGGWTGTVERVQRRRPGEPAVCDVRWDRRTLRSMHPIYRKRCERDDMECEVMGLPETELEPDAGSPVPIERPGHIVARPLNPRNQNDRIRAALGLTSDDAIPAISEKTLRRYYKHLSKHLRFPIKARASALRGRADGDDDAVTLFGLTDPDEFIEEEYGLFCHGRSAGRSVDLPLAEVEVSTRHPHCRLLDDYACWLCNWQ